jgi:hypothetical protein
MARLTGKSLIVLGVAVALWLPSPAGAVPAQPPVAIPEGVLTFAAVLTPESFNGAWPEDISLESLTGLVNGLPIAFDVDPEYSEVYVEVSNAIVGIGQAQAEVLGEVGALADLEVPVGVPGSATPSTTCLGGLVLAGGARVERYLIESDTLPTGTPVTLELRAQFDGLLHSGIGVSLPGEPIPQENGELGAASFVLAAIAGIDLEGVTLTDLTTLNAGAPQILYDAAAAVADELLVLDGDFWTAADFTPLPDFVWMLDHGVDIEFDATVGEEFGLVMLLIDGAIAGTTTVEAAGALPYAPSLHPIADFLNTADVYFTGPQDVTPKYIPAVIIPEPATMLLLVGGGAAVAGYARRRRRA